MSNGKGILRRPSLDGSRSPRGRPKSASFSFPEENTTWGTGNIVTPSYLDEGVFVNPVGSVPNYSGQLGFQNQLPQGVVNGHSTPVFPMRSSLDSSGYQPLTSPTSINNSYAPSSLQYPQFISQHSQIVPPQVNHYIPVKEYVPVPVEKVVALPVNHIVEKQVPVDRVVQVPVYVDRFVDRYVQIPVDRPVMVPFKEPMRSVGIGLSLERADGEKATYVERVVKGFAADRNGRIQAGDEVVAINDIDVRDVSIGTMKQLTVGPEGSYVKLDLLRGSFPFTVTLERSMPTHNSYANAEATRLLVHAGAGFSGPAVPDGRSLRYQAAYPGSQRTPSWLPTARPSIPLMT